MDPMKLILEADIVVKGVIILLAVLSVVSWAIIIQKMLLFQKVRKNCEQFLDFFRADMGSSKVLDRAHKATMNPLASLVLHANHALHQGSTTQSDRNILSRALERTKEGEIWFLENKLSFLATTGSAAPFIGLFGTVWGIMNAFLNIGEKGATNLAVVAPGIAEALIATAIGLVAAIPAVIGYNYCVQKIRGITHTMDQFVSELTDSNIFDKKS